MDTFEKQLLAKKTAFQDMAKEKEAERQREYRRRCSYKVNAYQRERKVNKLPWGDKYKQEIQSIYEESKRLTEETGVPHEVDHIVPLKGKRVSGLHVPWNLKPTPKEVNRAKRNKYEDWGK